MSYGNRSTYRLTVVTTSTIIFLAVMAVGVLAYAAIRPDFISTPELEWQMVLTSVLMIFGLGHSFARQQFKEFKDGLEKRNSKAVARTLRNFMVAGVFVWFIALEFFSGPLSYLSHVCVEQADTVRTISVLKASEGRRRCQNHATLQLGENAIWASRLCHISDRETEQLRQGGAIRAHGVFTRYGMQIKSFEVISAGQ